VLVQGHCSDSVVDRLWHWFDCVVDRVPKSMKIGFGGNENQRKSSSGGVLWALGSLVDDSVGFFYEAWQQDDANWSKLGPSWQQVALKSRQDAAKITSLVNLSLPLERFLKLFCSF
jgi:hypothetical protein